MKKNAILTIVFLMLTLISFTQEKVFFEKSKVSITPPEGFQQVDFFDGFFNYSNGASIQLEPIESIAYLLFAEGFTKETLEPQGVTLISKENVTAPNGKKGVMVVMTFEITQKDDQTGVSETREYERIVYLTGDMNKTIFLSVNYPVVVKELVYDELIKSIYTVQFED